MGINGRQLFLSSILKLSPSVLVNQKAKFGQKKKLPQEANIFDKEKVQAEIDLQVKVTQQFDRTRQDMKQIINKKIDEYKDKNPDKAKDWQNAGLLLDMLTGGRLRKLSGNPTEKEKALLDSTQSAF